MKTYGELIRELRIKKGISQKQLYEKIMSKSYAIRFEQGKHEISFYLLKLILDQLSMEVDEFLFIFNGYHSSEIEQFYYEYGEKGNQNDIDGLISMRTKLQKNPTSVQAELRIAELTARIEQLTAYEKTGIYSKKVIDKHSLMIIQEYLSKVQTWTLGELRLFANTLDYIDYERKSEYFETLLRSIDRYKNFERGRKVICTLLINEIHELVLANDLVNVERLMNKLNEFTTGVDEMFFRNYCLFYEGLLLDLKGEPKSGRKKVEQAIEIFTVLGYQHQAELSRSIYQKLSVN
ncbi:helix-turn-helix domain-containing protein [Enterococcus caccae]|uniref:Transcriptional activator, Rgg/GadR/MutR family domain-containing protein n=1 Tax=Enterococcus caccae ATCC BAA-1240 TaxID=1158612 RepID=R3U7S8_9ENTE|nr:Rgg/GadR/MutR family transcriptional regulator [Enterococcus caccae]EOL49989.1 transcriptional activator, Rgg/GadR/MutR family domain-containing protein [Enterococcus caccae ATCC BAA-1240]EOT56329.1 hypothetical protein I580_03129 [Enterococcus caccae ATCC BAA-1240]OJG26490.1 transcriptional activator, Rgg/GadR/MutR family domain-containing protein [Enterococcus caccae]